MDPRALLLSSSLLLLASPCMASGPVDEEPEKTDLGEHGFLDSGGVRLHYVASGSGPLVVLLHGFPDFWYSWRAQMPALAKRYQVVAVDLRGYNYSDKPDGVEEYALEKLVEDVAAVIRHFERQRAVIVGHDWGGAIAWSFAMRHPAMTDRLIVLNLPHPAGLLRELATNPAQQANSQYARDFQKPDAAAKLSPEMLTFWIRDEAARQRYIEAFRRSSIEGMLNFYKANYPRPPYEEIEREFPPVRCPVLMLHGLDDPALLAGALNDTWKWVEKDLTITTVPGAGHWVHHDAADFVTRALLTWLGRDEQVLSPADEERVEAVIKRVDLLCRNETVHMIGPEKARRLAELVRQEKPALVVECGTALGYSALWIARELARLGSGRLVTIEIDEDRARRAREHLREAGLEAYVEVRVGDARKLAGTVAPGVDFLFLDCNFSNYGPCFRGVRDKLADGALLVADNVGIGESSMRDYLDEVRSKHESNTEWFAIDLPWAKRDAFEVTRFRPEKSAGK